MNTKAFYFLLIAFFTYASQAISQKFGHLNSANLLLEMPEIKEADKELSAYQKGLIAAGKELGKAFELNYNKYIEDANTGTLSAVRMKQRESELQTENQNIQNYEVQIQSLLAIKKEELYSPILDKVRNALQDIGKVHGYTMIFDSSTGMLLHAIESEDVTNLVKAKLEIQ